ncbi:MAG: hypothetical protein O2954_07735 [bacterium]|nr:hypothetical protein [bacterium]
MKDNRPIASPYLIFEQEPRAGEHVRIWFHGDGRFGFEHLQASGKGTSISCPTLGDAMLLWKQIKRRLARFQVAVPGEF